MDYSILLGHVKRGAGKKGESDPVWVQNRTDVSRQRMVRWPGRDRVFLLYLGTMMLPGLVMMIPNYQIMIELGLVDTYAGLILPAAFSAFGTFLLRQFMLSIPSSLDEAAEIDGASKWRIFWDVILPLARPGLITLAVFTFVGNYHSFFWPLVMLESTHR